MELKVYQLIIFYLKKNPNSFKNIKSFISSNFPEDWKSGVFELFSYAESLGCGILDVLHQHLPITCQVAGLVVTHVAYHYMTYFRLLDLVLKCMHYYAHVTPALAVFGIGAAILTGQWPVSFDLLTCKPLTLSSDWLYKLTEDLGELPRLPQTMLFLYEDEGGESKAISLAYVLPEFQKQSNLSVFTEEEYNKFRSFKLTCKEDLAFLDDLDISSLDTPILTKNSDTTKNTNILISLGVSTLFFLVAFAFGGKGV